MTNARAWLHLTVVVLTLLSTSCGGADLPSAIQTVPGDPSTRMTDVAAIQTVPGDPSTRVTDVAAAQLTDSQVRALEEACDLGGGIPGSDCKGLPPPTALPTQPIPPVECQSRLCGYVGVSAADSDVGVLLIVDDRPGSPACGGEVATLCDGITVDAAVLEPLISAARDAISEPHVASEPQSEPAEPTSMTDDGDAATSNPGTSPDDAEATSSEP